jgi:mRNA-degrading endonuclease RelE of RelBE toxin-antitoxin system
MDKISKFLKKLNKQERKLLLSKIVKLKKGDLDDLDIKKIRGTSHYRLRAGRIRVIFSYNNGGFELIIITWRNDNTYKNIK